MTTKLTWSLIKEYISSKNPEKKWLKIPFDKNWVYHLNIFHTKWINKSLLPKYIRNKLENWDFYVAWLDNSSVLWNPFIYKERKAEFEIEFKKYLNFLISKYKNKIDISDSLMELNNTVELDISDNITPFVEKPLSSKEINQLDEQTYEKSLDTYNSLLTTNRYSKLAELFLHEKIIDKIISKGNFTEIKYITLNPNLDWNLQKKVLMNQPEEDNFKLILSRNDISPEILNASLASKRYKKYALLNPCVSSTTLDKFVDSINKLTERDEIKAALKNPNISETAVRKIFKNLNRVDQKEFIPLLKGKTLSQLEKNNLVWDILSNKHLTFNISAQTPFSKTQFETYLIPFFESLTDLEDKKMFLVAILQNPFVKLNDVKNFRKERVFSSEFSLTNIEKTYFMDLLKKYDLKTVKEGMDLFSYNIELEELENSVNSREIDWVSKTWFSYKVKDGVYIIGINTKWFSIWDLDSKIKEKVVKAWKDLYVSFSSSAYYFPGALVLDERDIIYSEYKDDFISQTKALIKRLSNWKEIVNKEPKFELKSSVAWKEREINLTSILKSTGYYFNFDSKANLFENQELFQLQNSELYYRKLKKQISTIETEIEQTKKNILDFINLQKNRPLEPTWELNVIKRTTSWGYYLNYNLNSKDIEYIRTRMKTEDFNKVFSINYTLDSSILKSLLNFNPNLKELLKEYSYTTSAYVKEKANLSEDDLETINKEYKEDIGIELEKKFEVENKTMEELQLCLDSFYLIRNVLEDKVKKVLSNFIYINEKQKTIELKDLYVVNAFDVYKFQDKKVILDLKSNYESIFSLKDKMFDYLKKATNTDFLDDIFLQRKTQKVKDVLLEYKNLISHNADWLKLFELLENKLYLEKTNFEDYIKETITNTKGLYTLKNLGGYDDLVKEIIKEKRAAGEYSLRFDDNRHYISK